MTVVARLEPSALDAAAELDQLLRSASGTGAVVSFVGLTRPHNHKGERVERLVLEHHPHLTLESLSGIANDAATRFPVDHVRVVHRCGHVAPGEPIVFAGAAATHRRAAFEAADYLMDRLKTDAVLWKKEEGPSGAAWIEPSDIDYADRARWE
jgi:molybdopterin synthase catalytic subunit